MYDGPTQELSAIFRCSSIIGVIEVKCLLLKESSRSVGIIAWVRVHGVHKESRCSSQLHSTFVCGSVPCRTENLLQGLPSQRRLTKIFR